MSVGDRVADIAPAPGAVEDGATVATAPPIAQWPRPAAVVRRVREGPTVVSLWLRDPLAGQYRSAAAGQYLRLHTEDGTGPVWRSYTISGTRDDLLRISVKHTGTHARMSALTARLPDAHAQLFLTKARTSEGAVRHRRPDKTDWALLTQDLEDITVHLCGPVSFMRDARESLLDLGATIQIRTETFASPSRELVGEHRVVFDGRDQPLQIGAE